MESITGNILDNINHGNLVPVVLLVVGVILALRAIKAVVTEIRSVGTISYLSKATWVSAALGAVLMVASLYMPYEAQLASQIALVIGNTQNSPAAKLSNELKEEMSDMLLRYKGANAGEVADVFSVVGVSGSSKTIELDEAKLKSIGKNDVNAKNSIESNLTEIERQLSAVVPDANGADYLEGIMQASDNVSDNSRIVVIGSGLSDSGDLDFAHTDILTDEIARKEAIDEITKKFGDDYLQNREVVFYGLGDSVPPQQSLGSYQKAIVREIYKDVVVGLGGRAYTDTHTLSGDSVETNYTVDTTDTGCGNIGLTFSDDKIKFDPDRTTFANPDEVGGSLSQVKSIYDEEGDNITKIAIDGYTAHYQSRVDNLSQKRAEAVKQKLIEMGLPESVLIATGKGYGPFEYVEGESDDAIDSKNRMIRITIERNADKCEV